MGKRHSRLTSVERSLAKRNGKSKLPQNIHCPICNMMFVMRMNTYADVDKHMDTHLNEEIEKDIEPPEDQKYPESEAVILPARYDLCRMKVDWGASHISIYVNRETLLEDSLNQVLNLETEALRSEFHIFFNGEHGSDAGGLTKEWLGLVIKELFKLENGFFRLSLGSEPRYLPVPHNDTTQYYILAGIIIGKALLENIPLDCALARSILKQLLGMSISIHDLKLQDADLYKSLKFLKKNQIDGIFFETFSVNYGDKVVAIIENGENIQVTEENKETYLLLRSEYELYGSMADSIEGIKAGLSKVVPKEIFDGFSADDLDFMICGSPVINLKDWKENTEYGGEFSTDHQVVRWFWEIVFGLSQKMLRDLLQFVTGTSRVPIDGFRDLRTIRGDPAMFKIVPIVYTKGVLPRAHTCFNRLDLPIFHSKMLMKNALIEVLKYHTLGFGLE